MYLPLVLEIILLIFIGFVYLLVNRKLKYLQREEEVILHKARKRGHRIIQEARDATVQITAQAREEMRAGIEKTLTQTAKQLQEEARGGLGKLNETLQKQTVISQEKIDAELLKYRQEKLHQVDKQITQVLQTTAKAVLGRVLSLSEHTELVNQALEEAKNQHVFDPA